MTKARCALARLSLWRVVLPGIAIAAVAASAANAQDKGTLNPKPLPPLANPNDPKTPAKELFGRRATAAPLQARSIGFYAKGCLAGAVAMPINGKTWQVMRLSRNRNWGHPNLIAFLEQLSQKAPQVGWRGLLVGDISQARGGPMLTGHASHQVGLDADIWLTPMPNRELTRLEREEMSATMVVAKSRTDVDPNVWTPAHAGIIKTAAEDPRVERIFVNAAIKKALCRSTDTDRSWLRKVRPMWGHDYHFHIRMSCPAGSPDAGSGATRRRLRQGARLVVPRRRHQAQGGAQAGSGRQAEAATADDNGRPAARLPPGAAGALAHEPEPRRNHCIAPIMAISANRTAASSTIALAATAIA
jgi:penicillin-insensitive murein DD-endopeptidase